MPWIERHKSQKNLPFWEDRKNGKYFIFLKSDLDIAANLQYNSKNYDGSEIYVLTSKRI